jgi:hypothetical protein
MFVANVATTAHVNHSHIISTRISRISLECFIYLDIFSEVSPRNMYNFFNHFIFRHSKTLSQRVTVLFVFAASTMRACEDANVDLLKSDSEVYSSELNAQILMRRIDLYSGETLV